MIYAAIGLVITLISLGILFIAIKRLSSNYNPTPYIINMKLYVYLSGDEKLHILPVSEASSYYIQTIKAVKRSLILYQSMYPIIYNRFGLSTSIGFVFGSNRYQSICISSDEAGIRVEAENHTEYIKFIKVLEEYYAPRKIRSVLIYTNYQK